MKKILTVQFIDYLVGTVLMIFFNSIYTTAQSITPAKAFANEVLLTTDNDILFITDQYYTAGENLNYHYQTKKKIPLFHNNDSSKTIVSFEYGIKVFNPKNLETTVTQYMDRPYCGWNYIGANVLNFRNKNSGNLFSVQFGLVGEISGIGNFQKWWHKSLGLYTLQGWDSQIRDEAVINLNYNHTHGFPIGKGIELVSSSGAWIGTGSNKISQELTLRLFQFNPLGESSWMNAAISRNKPPKQECFVYVSFEEDYIFSNIFIEGSLFNNSSPFVTTINPWLLTRKIGIQYSENRVTLGIAFVHLAKETEFVSTHDYATIVISRRF